MTPTIEAAEAGTANGPQCRKSWSGQSFQATEVEMGEGRITQCLEAAGDKVSQSCRRAMQDTGLQ